MWLESRPQQSRRVLAKFIYELQQEKQLREAEPLLAATLFHDMISFYPTHKAMIEIPLIQEELHVFIDEAVMVFIHGYGV